MVAGLQLFDGRLTSLPFPGLRHAQPRYPRGVHGSLYAQHSGRGHVRIGADLLALYPVPLSRRLRQPHDARQQHRPSLPRVQPAHAWGESGGGAGGRRHDGHWSAHQRAARGTGHYDTVRNDTIRHDGHWSAHQRAARGTGHYTTIRYETIRYGTTDIEVRINEQHEVLGTTIRHDTARRTLKCASTSSTRYWTLHYDTARYDTARRTLKCASTSSTRYWALHYDTARKDMIRYGTISHGMIW